MPVLGDHVTPAQRRIASLADLEDFLLRGVRAFADAVPETVTLETVEENGPVVLVLQPGPEDFHDRWLGITCGLALLPRQRRAW
jgi:hypothetical protein